MSGKPPSSIGFERRHNAALLETNRDSFVEEINASPPAKPLDFVEMIAANRRR